MLGEWSQVKGCDLTMMIIMVIIIMMMIIRIIIIMMMIIRNIIIMIIMKKISLNALLLSAQQHVEGEPSRGKKINLFYNSHS